jgi:hypothetical protein
MRMYRLTVLLALMAFPQVAPAAAPALQSVAVFPRQVDLTTLRDRQGVVVQATFANGITRDVTGQATFKLADESLAKIEAGIVSPVKDGQTELSVTFQGHELKVPVKVARATEERPISFRLDVIPVFTKASCNNGSCHGASRGKDGFMLSLFGYDPAGDHFRITRQQPGRRINLGLVTESLLLTKATGKAQHTGGQLFTEDSELYATLLRWLESGAPDDPADVATVTGIDVLPDRFVLESGDPHKITVIAHYSDGTDRDVTSMAALMSNNESSAAIDAAGVITARQRGEAFVFARFDKYTVGAQAIVIPRDLDYTWPDVPENNYIDTLVNAKLRKLRILPSELCSDEQFMRRVYIDIVGTLPTAAEYEAFMADTETNKREKLVDALLERKEFVEIWVMKFTELLRIRSGNVAVGQISYKAAVLYANWLSEQIADNVPMNRIVQDLLGASGSTFTNPATNFYQLERDTKKLAEDVAQVFMGMRIQCAQCHNHPFDRWTMDDYYGFVAFFSQIGRKTPEDPRDVIVFNSGGGEVTHPVGGRAMPPKFLGGAMPDVAGKDRRKVLAEWLASPENPYFARNLANTVWAHFFGRGIVEPVDDVRVSNPPSNPELLDELGRKFTEYNYDFKKLVRDICTSRTYQLSTQVNGTNELDTSNFSHAYVRRMRAEVIYDAISQVTQTRAQDKFRGLPQGARAVQITDGAVNTYFLTTFGRATRETVCSCEVKMEPNLSQALHLMNGETVHQKIVAGGLIKRMLDEKQTPQQIVDYLYTSTVCRKPTEQERAAILQEHAAQPPEAAQQFFEDLFWALLNSKEFMFNH